MRSMLEKRLRDIKTLAEARSVGLEGGGKEEGGRGGRCGRGPDRFSGSWQQQQRLINPAEMLPGRVER